MYGIGKKGAGRGTEVERGKAIKEEEERKQKKGERRTRRERIVGCGKKKEKGKAEDGK